MNPFAKRQVGQVRGMRRHLPIPAVSEGIHGISLEVQMHYGLAPALKREGRGISRSFHTGSTENAHLVGILVSYR